MRAITLRILASICSLIVLTLSLSLLVGAAPRGVLTGAQPAGAPAGRSTDAQHLLEGSRPQDVPTSLILGERLRMLDVVVDRSSSTASCTSPRGLQVSWRWVNQTLGIVLWTMHNPTDETLAVSLIRGAHPMVPAYCFGNAFWPAYLSPTTAFVELGTGPYPPQEELPVYMQLAILKAQKQGMCFVFTVAANSSIYFTEAGFPSPLTPYCESVVDVDFVENRQAAVDYTVESHCALYFLQQRVLPPYCCPSNPVKAEFPVYAFANSSVPEKYYYDSGVSIHLGAANGSTSVQYSCYTFGGTSSNASCCLGVKV
ncbi:hypothetical protein CDCA_CDCA01G0095 [Cyanidium caldarium]|uniref:Pherophorin domain-containing protein n=1 Tax=Cyanidium caldarium TaxID=2771 RepID=A0AAV9IPP8_CYACA|nr:hypothetical protein CDCA_CDCA01G0095 [Cyanidium caldarium]